MFLEIYLINYSYINNNFYCINITNMHIYIYIKVNSNCSISFTSIKPLKIKLKNYSLSVLEEITQTVWCSWNVIGISDFGQQYLILAAFFFDPQRGIGAPREQVVARTFLVRFVLERGALICLQSKAWTKSSFPREKNQQILKSNF